MTPRESGGFGNTRPERQIEAGGRDEMNELFPLFLKLAGRPCLVVGGGPVAEAKMEGLVRCGAEVRVVAPEATPGIREAARLGGIVWEQRRVFAVRSRGQCSWWLRRRTPLNCTRRFFAAARQAGILCNAVDEPQRCDFYYPAVVRRGALQIAISTAGHSPFLAQRLRRELEERFGPEYAAWLEEIGRQRRELIPVGYVRRRTGAPF